MKKVVLVTSEFTFHSAATSRLFNWCFASLKNNNIVVVFDIGTSAFHEFYSIEELRLAYEKTLQREAVYRGQSNSKSGGIKRRIKYLLHLDLIPLSMGFYRSLIMARKSVNKHTKVLVSTPSPKVLIFGLIIARKGNDYLVDFRDQWYGHPLLPHSKGIVRKYILRLISKRATSVVTVSDFIAEKLEALLGRDVRVVHNTVSCFRETSVSEKIVHPNTIVYTGSLPENYFNLDLLASVIRQCGSQYKWNFYGDNSNFEQRFRGPVGISFMGYQKAEVVKKAQESADYNLFVGADYDRNAGIITTKIWEYILSGRPILTFDIKKPSDVRDILEKYCSKGITPIDGLECYYPKNFEKSLLLNSFLDFVK